MDRKYVALLVLLVLAVFTRFFGIEFQSLWVDEGATYYYSQLTWDELLSINEPNSPVYYVIEGWFLEHLGHSEFALRFISAVAGVITVMMGYFIAEKMFGKWQFSILVAALFLISTFCLEYSQEARGYELVLMFFMFQFYVFLYAIETKKILHWILFVILGVAGMMMQYTAILATITMVLYALYAFYREMVETGNRKPLLGLLALCAIAAVASYPFWSMACDAFSLHLNRSVHWDWCPMGLDFTIDVFRQFFSRFALIALAMFVLMIFGILYCRKAYRKEYNMLMWIMIFPLALATILSFFVNLTPRYIIWVIPVCFIFVALSFYYWGTDQESMKRANAVAVASLVLIACTALPCYYTEPTKSDFRGSAEVLNAYAHEGDVVVYAPNWDILVYSTLSFYYVPSEHGVDAVPYNSHQQITDLSKDPKYGNVFVLIENVHDPYQYLMDHRSSTCVEIFSGHTNYLFMITAPM